MVDEIINGINLNDISCCGICRHLDFVRNTFVCGKKCKIIMDIDDCCNDFERGC